MLLPGTAHKASLCLVLEGRGDVCVQQEDSGRGVQAGQPRSHPLPKPAFQRKSRLRPQWPAGLALGPCHVEQEDVSPTAWPRLPLTPPVSTHCGPYSAVYTQKSVPPKPAPGSGGLTQSQ